MRSLQHLGCSIEACKKPYYGKGLCEMHGARLRRNGHTDIVRRLGNPVTAEPEYVVWVSMKGRCLNPNDWAYYNYGGRGIRVCKRWIRSYSNFVADMGKRPEGYSIERINNDGNYEPSNCRWATRSEQQRNKRTYPKSGYKYVYFMSGKWRVVKDRAYHGHFDTKEEAVACAQEFYEKALAI